MSDSSSTENTENTKKPDTSNSQGTSKAGVTINTNVLDQKLGYSIRMIDRMAGKEVAIAAGMTPVQYSMLALVATNEGMPQGAIGEALNMDRASTMAVMDKLERAGLIERRKSLIDRRMHALYLTENGRREYADIEVRVVASDDKFKNKLTEEELKAFIGSLKKLLR